MSVIWKPGDPVDFPVKIPAYTGGRGNGVKRRPVHPHGDMIGGHTNFERALLYLLNEYFGSGHWRVISEVHKYRPSLVKEVIDQYNGTAPEICEVYFDGKFVCDVQKNWGPAVITAKVSEALLHIKFK